MYVAVILSSSLLGTIWFLISAFPTQGFPHGRAVKHPPVNEGDARDVGLILGLGRSSGVGNGNPLQYSCLEDPHGQRSLAGYSPWGRTESDTTEHVLHSLQTDTDALYLSALQFLPAQHFTLNNLSISLTGIMPSPGLASLNLQCGS